MSSMVQWGLVASVALPLGLGALAGYATRGDVKGQWYQSLEKPGWQPPSYIFGPVWTVLYVLMGVAAWRVWKAGGRTEPMTLYALQLGLNVAWSFLFFRARNLKWAVLDILALLSVLVATTTSFYRVDKVAGYLMMPYLAWVTFATVLTLSIYTKNKDK